MDDRLVLGKAAKVGEHREMVYPGLALMTELD